MPELPEVERGRKQAEAVARGQKIVKVWLDDDPIVFDKTSRKTFTKALLNHTVLEVCRHGKQLWFELDTRPWPLFHFGMTGGFQTSRDDAFALKTGPDVKDRSWPPKFTKIHLWFENGGELVMTNARRFGRIRLRQDPRNEAPIQSLGFDPYLELPPLKEFEGALSKRKVSIKGLLLNQKFAAGVGNWIADEVLYQAGVAPARRSCDLEPHEVKRIRTKLAAVIKKAVEVDAEKSKFPKNWLFHHRWGQDQDAQTAKGETIAFDTVAGRTTAWVPTFQR